jgi:trehalose 6-phosphate phosphatase
MAGVTQLITWQPIGITVPLDPRELHQFAVLLDVDGTILDIAPTPDQVKVPQSLLRTLTAIRDHVDGALALVSGRPVADLDIIFKPLQLAAIGGHGAEIRPRGDASAPQRHAKSLDPGLKRRLTDIAARRPGVTIEDKDYSLALHYRQAPAQGADVVDEVKRACEGLSPREIEVLPGRAVIEVKSAGFNKGTAVRLLMSHPPFAGRRPIFIGDDKTDEAAFAVVPEFDGIAVSVGRQVPGAEDRFKSPSEVRQWLERLAESAAVPT